VKLDSVALPQTSTAALKKDDRENKFSETRYAVHTIGSSYTGVGESVSHVSEDEEKVNRVAEKRMERN
jgi:hypothetical protein